MGNYHLGNASAGREATGRRAKAPRRANAGASDEDTSAGSAGATDAGATAASARAANSDRAPARGQARGWKRFYGIVRTERLHPGRRGKAEVLERGERGLAALRSTHDETTLEQVGLVDVL